MSADKRIKQLRLSGPPKERFVTCVIGLVDENNKVYMGWDSSSMGGWDARSTMRNGDRVEVVVKRGKYLMVPPLRYGGVYRKLDAP